MKSDRYEYLKEINKTDKGVIFNTDETNNTGSWIAVTASTSQGYKTLKNAQNYMAMMRYHLI